MDNNKVGQPEYIMAAQFLSSPIVFILIIINCAILVFSSMNLSVLGNIASSVITILMTLGIIITYTSAKRYMNTGQPMTTTGLNIWSGCIIAEIVCVCIVCGVMVLLDFIYLTGQKSSRMAIGIGLIIAPVAAFALLLMYLITYRRTIKALRYKISDTAPCNASMFPVIFGFICAGLGFFGLITTLSSDFLSPVIDNSLYSIEQELSPGLRDIYRIDFNMSNMILYAISSIISLLGTVVESIFLLKAKRATDYRG